MTYSRCENIYILLDGERERECSSYGRYYACVLIIRVFLSFIYKDILEHNTTAPYHYKGACTSK